MGQYFFVPTNPNSIEQGSYNRHASNTGPFFWTSTTAIAWRWACDSTLRLAAGSPWPRVRFCDEAGPLTPWLQPSTNAYPFVFDEPNGHHLARPEVDVSGVTVLARDAKGVDVPTPLSALGVQVLAKPFVINDTGAPLPQQAPWVVAVRHDLNNDEGAYGETRVTWPGTWPAPKRFPRKPRAYATMGGAIPAENQLYVRRLGDAYNGYMQPRFAILPTGDVVVERVNKYPYTDATSTSGFRSGQVAPRVEHRDGPPGIGTLGYTFKTIARKLTKGLYFSDANGRIGFQFIKSTQPPAGQTTEGLPFTGEEGEIVTFVGWRDRPGQPRAHTGIKEPGYMHAMNAIPALRRAGDAQFYEDSCEFLGDWSRVRGNKRFSELWGFGTAKLRADGSIDDRDGMEFWACDTLNHRIVFVNAWTMHPPFFYQRPDFPPLGYTDAPAAATGQSQVAVFLDGNGDGLPSEYLNEPWDCVVHPGLRKIIWTNFAGDSVCMANLDGSGAELLIGPPNAVPASDVQLGIGQRLDDAVLPGMTAVQTVAYHRAHRLVDGAQGTALLTRPQGLEVDDDGNIVFYERYTFAVRRVDMATRTVKTVGTIAAASLGFSASGDNDSMVAIDRQGYFGPKGDIVVNPWREMAAHRFGKDGTARGPLFRVGAGHAVGGPLDTCRSPDYRWAMCFSDDTPVMHISGNAGGSMLLEISKRLPEDGPNLDTKLFEQGYHAWTHEGNPPLSLTHGPNGQGRLGFPTVVEMGAWDDATLRAYLSGLGAVSLDALVYWISWHTRDFDYTQEDPQVIAQLQQQLVEAQAKLDAAGATIAQLTADRDAQAKRADANAAALAALNADIDASQARDKP